MTDREKAIGALIEYNDYLNFIPTIRNIAVIDEAIKYLKEPSLDDAIAVVENELKKLQDELPFNAIFKREYKFGIQALEYILTTLKGLKEGK